MDIRNLQLQVVTLRLCRPFLPLSLGKHQDTLGTAHCLRQKAFCQESPHTQKAEGTIVCVVWEPREGIPGVLLG